MADRKPFAPLRPGRRVWAIAAVHGEAERLAALHAHLAGRIEPGESLVYLGNYLGHGAKVQETLDEILLFRRELLARPGAHVCDLAYLRGCQEEMWQKLQQVQFSVGPRQVIDWMLGQGVAATIAAYGGKPDDGLRAAGQGATFLTKWTSALRDGMRARPGHGELMSALKHAAFTRDGRLLFVSAGLDPARPLSQQADSFWWGGPDFDRIAEPYSDYRLVVRGFDPRKGGARVGPHTATLDQGCGFGGPLSAVCFSPEGEPVEFIDA
ncbi:MAG: hypothetical protein H7841_12125 [Magnetospirillum sp. WYHS-4]